MDVNGLTTY